MKFKNIFRIVARVLIFIFFAFNLLLALSYAWMVSKWGVVSMDEILFELTASLNGASGTLVSSYILRALLPTVIILILGIVLLLTMKRRNIRLLRFYFPVVFLLTISLLAGTVAHAWNRISLGFYLKGLVSDSSYVQDNYVNPDSVKITFPEKKRNLICIYLESMELAFADKEHGGLYDENTIPKLTRIGMENEMFTADGQINGGNSLFGSTYTMGALVAMTCGLPIRRDVELSDMQSIYPDITALGNILDRNGYTQMLSIGSYADFGGRGTYFRDHGNYMIRDYQYAEDVGRVPEGYYRWWGFEDEKLYSYAKEDLLELAESGEPFHYSMLTVDTHFEDGYVCRLCGNEFGDDQYRNVFRCADNQIADFLDWIKEQDFYENTTILLTGDHPSMDRTLMEITPEDYTRKTFTCFLNAAREYTGTEPRQYSTMDLFPTTLAALGADIQGEKLGLGTNLFSSEKTLIENSSVEYVNNELNASSDFLSHLLGFDSLSSMVDTRYAFHTFYDPFKELLYISIDGDMLEDENVENIYVAVTDEKGNVRRRICRRPGESKQYRGVMLLKGLGEHLHITVSIVRGDTWELLHEYNKTRGTLFAERELSGYLAYIEAQEGVTVLAAKRGEIGNISERDRGFLERLGIDPELLCESGMKYCAMIQNGKAMEVSEPDKAEIKGTFASGKSYYALSEDWEGGICTVSVDGIEYSQDRDGINFVMCDHETGEVISSASFDLRDVSRDTSIDIYSYNAEDGEMVVSMYGMQPRDRLKLIGGFVRIMDPEKGTFRECPLYVYGEEGDILFGELDISGFDPENIVLDFFWTDNGCGCYFGGRIEGDVTVSLE